ncbi:MAG TPA: hypothetical protein VHU88_11090 [Sporichthyaceae bacterium]|jgi:hypothetical protein|nr:hypothetical protein [Sporichthyaceae bacterium]
MADRRARRAAWAAILAAGIAPFVWGGSARADATYEASANATGVKVIFSNQSIPLGVAPQAQGPTAAVKQTSLRQSDGYAAFPDPGEDVAGLPGVAGGALHLPLPGYPFLVSTSYGDDVRRLNYPGIELSSESGDTITQATATGGSKGVGATSIARIARDGDSIAATSTSDADVLRLGDSLVVTGLHAAAGAARDATGKLTRTSSLSFSSISVPGLALTVPPPPGSTGAPEKLTAPQIGFENGDFTVTLPGAPANATPVPAKDVFAAFEQAGYHVSYQAPQNTTDGIVGAGLQIATTLPAPPGSPGGVSGQTPVTLTMGLSQAAISYRGAGDTGTATPGVAASSGALNPPAAPGAAPAGMLPSIGTAVSVPPPAIGTAPAVAAAGAPTQPVDFAALTANRKPLSSDVSWLYLMVGGVGVAGALSLLVLRWAGGRA